MMHRIIGYVGIKDLPILKEEDIKRLDIINLAFGHVNEGIVTWDHRGNLEYIEKARVINPHIKFILSVGGWSAGGFSEAASTESNRKNFAISAAELVKEYKLDGIDIDWEYPCYSVAGIGASKADKENYTLLLEALRKELDRLEDKYHMLTIAVGAGDYFTRCTEMDKAQVYLDYVQLMTYDLRGGFQVVTGHHSNLYTNQVDLFNFSVDQAVKTFLEAGVPKEKLVIGVAFYSREWRGVPDVDNGYMQMAKTTGGYGPSYHALVEEYVNKNDYVRYWDDEAKAPYLFNGNHFISYEDEESIAHKVAYMKEQGLGGVMYWEYCCDKTFTLTGWIHKQVNA